MRCFSASSWIMAELVARTILLVEDEDLLRSAVATALRRDGYSVLQAADGTVAVELLRTFPDKIDHVLLDVTLPGLSSREVLQEARRLRPAMHVILTSALDASATDAFFPGLKADHFMPKPYRLATLLDYLTTVSGLR